MISPPPTPSSNPSPHPSPRSSSRPSRAAVPVPAGLRCRSISRGSIKEANLRQGRRRTDCFSHNRPFDGDIDQRLCAKCRSHRLLGFDRPQASPQPNEAHPSAGRAGPSRADAEVSADERLLHLCRVWIKSKSGHAFISQLPINQLCIGRAFSDSGASQIFVQ